MRREAWVIYWALLVEILKRIRMTLRRAWVIYWALLVEILKRIRAMLQEAWEA
jgi:hypothetical protein